ncbi:uncharacterized protein YlxW (UPF0749 family) [Pullulanibacillus pueri]|uniref:DUF881 domain-containing protein n=1 Tax=Pullulanibacillus pueri TaxID=1437324 RepID=A0A8J2ZRP9_9BACL|nr:DUF881 domain-containing protein [Pullulanibacillus pueri]MBM7680137.1 uncharacterized protein YlxW (UPF0749 family) [Pullulanibacillus pueri]GGH74531.1 hypothetical protein GCM10007096_02860 [Pullulanibacillus pueri]
MRNHRFSLAIILMVTGFIVVFSYQYFKKAESPKSEEANELWTQEHQLRTQLIKEQETNQSLEKKLENRREQVQSNEQTLANQKKEAHDIQKSLNNYRMLNGLTKVHGPGIRVSLEDAQYVPEEDDPNNYIVHQQDIQEVIYELYAAGAEGVSLNGQRLSIHSYIECVGPVVKIDGQKHTVPFIVEAIGDPHLLLSSLNMSGGTVDLLMNRGIKVSTEKKSDITLKPLI